MPEIIVCVKQVLSVADLKIDSSSRTLATTGVPKVISESDKSALEEAIRIKEKHGGTVRVLSLGPPEAKEAIREALAMGADEGYLVTFPEYERVDFLGVAKVLATAISKIGRAQLVLCGDASEDLYAGRVGPALGAILGTPVVTYARTISIAGDTITIDRDLEDQVEIIETSFPILLTTIREISEPRLPTLSKILAASKKPLVVWGLGDLALNSTDLEPALQVIESFTPSAERKRVLIDGKPDEAADKLAGILVGEGLVKG